MKRFVAILLVIVTLLTSILGTTGCSSQQKAELSFGQWLALINDSFGMESFINEEPYFTNIDKNNPYYSTVQIAREWDVVSGDYLDIGKSLTWKDAIITLVNVGNFLPVDSSEEEKIECGINKFDTSIRKYWMNRTIEADEAVALLSKAQELWANRKVTERIEEVKLRENVLDLSTKENKIISNQQDNKIILTGVTEDIKAGDICIVADETNEFEKKYIKVDSVEEADGNRIITPSDDEVKLEDVYEELHIEETIKPTAENTIIYDGNGNVVHMGASTLTRATSAHSPQITNLAMDGSKGGEIVNCAPKTSSFTIDGYTVKLGYDLDGKLNLSASVEMPNMLPNAKEKEKKGRSLKLSVGAEISDLEVTHRFDWGTEWIGFIPVPTLDSAELKVDYTLKQNFGITYAAQEEFLAAPEYSNGNGKYLTNFKRAIMKRKENGDVYGAETIASKKEIKICSLNIYSVGVAKVCLDVVASISVNGTLEISITESGSKGVEYRNGKLRFIKTNDRSVDAQFKAKVEAALGFGPALYVIGLKKRLVGVQVKVGVGASATVKAHLADSHMHLIEELDFNDTTPEQANEMAAVGKDITADAVAIQAVAAAQGGIFEAQAGAEVKLHIDWCLDIKAYGILSIGVNDESYLTDLLDTKKVNLSISILNEKNHTFFNMHIDNFKWLDASYNWGIENASKDNCTLKYIPFDKGTNEEITDDKIKESNNNISVGENLILSTMNVNMEVDQKFLVEIMTLPSGYKAEDVVFSSKNDKIAQISDKGVVTAVGEGCTVIYASTKDNKYKSFVAVIVKTATEVEFKGLGGGGIR